jgi:hypothetical protein
MVGKPRALELKMKELIEHACPNCSGTRLELRVEQSITVEFDHQDGHDVQDGPLGDLEWDDGTKTTCLTCGHAGTLKEMTNN